MTSRKRTHSNEDATSDDDARTHASVQRYPRGATTTPPPPNQPPRKRQRASGLEGTLAKLSLTPPHAPNLRLYPSADASDESQLGYDLDMDVENGEYVQPQPPLHAPPLHTNAHSFTVPLPLDTYASGDILRGGAVEEPLPEVKMRAHSWYEPAPDRIVVTDLDGSDIDAGSENEGGNPVVLPSALEMLQRQRTLVPPGLTPKDAERLALVPFRPPLFRAPEAVSFEDQKGLQTGIVEEDEGGEGFEFSASSGLGEDRLRVEEIRDEDEEAAFADGEEDAMDVEPMDIEF